MQPFFIAFTLIETGLLRSAEFSFHLLHGLVLNLPDTLGRDAEFRCQVMQGSSTAFLQPAGLDDAAAAIIKAVECPG